MSSRLYAAAFSSSASSDSENEAPLKPVEQRFFHVQSDSEDEKRVVRSAKDKRQEEMKNLLRSLNNHKKIKDMSHVMSDFEELVKLYEKANKMNELEKNAKFYIRCLAQMEDFINESWEIKKTLSKVAAKSLTVLKQRVKKYNKDFEEAIHNYRENPEFYEEEEEEEENPTQIKQEVATTSESESSDDEENQFASRKPTVKKVIKDSDDSSDDFDSEYSSSSLDSDSDLDIGKYADDPSKYFEKRPEKLQQVEKSKKKKPKVLKQHVPKEDTGDQGEWQTVDSSGRAEIVVQAFEKGVEITVDLVIKKFTEILANRGKTSSINEQISLLEQVRAKTEELHLGAGVQTKAVLSIITLLFDYESKHPAFMPIVKFQKSMEEFTRLFELLENNSKDLIVSDIVNEETESLATRPFRIQGSVLSVVGRLDDEYYKILQNSNGHEKEYDDRLRDEPKVCSLLDRLIEYLERSEAPPNSICSAYLRKVEHIYYKIDFDWARRIEEGDESAVPKDFSTMERLCQYIYKNDKTDRLRTRAILCHIYYLALFDYWYKARDLMLMSNLQASIDHADHSTMILYNRAMVQMGLCAFRQGFIRDAHNTLSDVTGSGRIRELLAQGLHMQPRYERTPEEEKREKALQKPYHMHINTELIECICLISAMLQEMPTLAACSDNDCRSRPFSKAFLMALRIHDRATLVGPPESPRDHVIAASKAMRMGNWRACIGFIFNPKMDAKIWVLFTNVKKVRNILEAKIKEESLRCYLFSFSSVHESISLARLAEHFELPKSLVYSIISKMIINQELSGSLEVPADFLTLHKCERSRLHSLALQLADKINTVLDMNEKLIDNRGGFVPGIKSSQVYTGRRNF